MAQVEELNDSNFETTLQGKDLAFVDVYASWCGPCRLFSPTFEATAEKHPKLAFFKVDGDKNPESRSELNINNLPFVAAFHKGKYLRGVSTSSEAGLEEFIRKVEEEVK